MEDFIYKELVNVKETTNKILRNYKNIFISLPIVQTEEKVVNNMPKRHNYFENGRRECHFSQQHFSIGIIMLFGNLLSRIRTFWYNMNSNKEANLSNEHNGINIINLSNYRSLTNDNSAIQLGSVQSVLKSRHSNHYQQRPFKH